MSLGVGVHRALEAADILSDQGYAAEVIDLRSVAPLDRKAVCTSVAKTGRLLVVDEDYMTYGLSGELAAVVLEAGLAVHYGRVCTEDTISYERQGEYHTLPNRERIVSAAKKLLEIPRLGG